MMFIYNLREMLTVVYSIQLKFSLDSNTSRIQIHTYQMHMNYICHGPAGVPRLATRCLCVLSTWLVVCLVPCAPMSIVCPLPSCYLIIVSVAPAVSPSLPSFVSLYSLLVSAVLCWSVVFRVSMSCELNVWLCSSLLPACLFFPFGVVFVLLFNFVIKTLNSSAFESSTSSPVTERISHDEDSAEGATGNHGSRA